MLKNGQTYFKNLAVFNFEQVFHCWATISVYVMNVWWDTIEP